MKVVVVVAGAAIDPPYGIESQSQRVAAEALVDCGTGTAGVVMLRRLAPGSAMTGQSEIGSVGHSGCASRSADWGQYSPFKIRYNKSRCLIHHRTVRNVTQLADRFLQSEWVHNCDSL